MNKNKITQNQYMFIVIGGMIGVGILSLPSGLCNVAHQQGWIPVFIGGLYPLFIVITASIIDNKTNHASFWEVNNQIYGKILSHIFIFIFFLNYLIIFSSVMSGFTNLLMKTNSRFIPRIYIILPGLILIALITKCGIYMVGRISELYFYLSLPLLVIPLFFLGKGSIINIKPIFSSFNEILKAIPGSFYAFGGCEISYLIISNISNRRNTKKAGIIAALITIAIYAFIVFYTIYCIGWEMASRIDYSLLYVIQSIPIPIISNFTSLFLFLWTAVILKTLVIECYGISCLLSTLIKIDYKKANFIFLPIVLVFIFSFMPEYNRITLLDIIYPYFIDFCFLWGLITTILVLIKFRGEKE